MSPIRFMQFNVPTARDLHQGDAIPAAAKFVRVTAIGQAIRWRDDGEDPTASVGHRISAGAELLYHGPLHALRFISESSGGAVAVTFYR